MTDIYNRTQGAPAFEFDVRDFNQEKYKQKNNGAIHKVNNTLFTLLLLCFVSSQRFFESVIV